jgi:hypothetical protein
LEQHGVLSPKKKAGTALLANRVMEVCELIFGLKQEQYAELAWLMYCANCHVHLVKRHVLKQTHIPEGNTAVRNYVVLYILVITFLELVRVYICCDMNVRACVCVCVCARVCLLPHVI